MTETRCGFFEAPVGYTRKYTEFRKHGCARHDTYFPGCSACGYSAIDVPVTLGGDILALILSPDDGSVVERLTSETPRETATTMAGWGDVVVRGDYADMRDWTEWPIPLRAIVHEAQLMADCRGTFIGELPESEVA